MSAMRKSGFMTDKGYSYDLGSLILPLDFNGIRGKGMKWA